MLRLNSVDHHLEREKIAGSVKNTVSIFAKTYPRRVVIE